MRNFLMKHHILEWKIQHNISGARLKSHGLKLLNCWSNELILTALNERMIKKNLPAAQCRRGHPSRTLPVHWSHATCLLKILGRTLCCMHVTVVICSNYINDHVTCFEVWQKPKLWAGYTLKPEYKMLVPKPDAYIDVNSDSKFCVSYTGVFEKVRQGLGRECKSAIWGEISQVLPSFSWWTCTSCEGQLSCCNEENCVLQYWCKIWWLWGNYWSQCECADGTGPQAHCKHVCTVLYAATVFVKKRTINTVETCTQKLQTFHKTKRFLGSPIKASELVLPGTDEFTNINPLALIPAYANSVDPDQPAPKWAGWSGSTLFAQKCYEPRPSLTK